MQQINEELSNPQLEAVSNFLANVYKEIKSAKENNGEIFPKKNTNKQFKQAIDLTNQCIIDLTKSFTKLKQTEIKRHIFRYLGNTGENISKKLEGNDKLKTALLNSWGVNTFENFDRLHKFIKIIHFVQKERMASGNKDYQDFSKEIAELDGNYKKFMQNRLSSIVTENYFSY